MFLCCYSSKLNSEPASIGELTLTDNDFGPPFRAKYGNRAGGEYWQLKAC